MCIVIPVRSAARERSGSVEFGGNAETWSAERIRLHRRRSTSDTVTKLKHQQAVTNLKGLQGAPN